MTAPKETKQKRTHHIDSRLTPEEYQMIISKAKATGYTASEYMRRVACGYPLQSIVDQLSVNELLQTRADLGRLGGLFKRWITENEKTKPSLGSKSGIFKFEYTLIDCASKESIPPYISLLNKFSIPYIVVYDKDHQQDKLQPARDVADRSSQKIEDTINNSFGKSVIFINDIEEELGIVAGNASKPYIALQEISQEEFAICTSLSEKITTIYE